MFIILHKLTLCQYRVSSVTAHSVKFKYSLSHATHPPDSVPVQCCQTATVNHALFLFVRSGTESGGVIVEVGATGNTQRERQIEKIFVP